MSCGCKATAEVRDRRRAAAVMCMLCRHRWLRGPRTVCGLTGLTVERAVIEGGCGRHPEAAGVLRWLGLRWYGVPAPLRWLLRLLIALRRVRPLTGPLDGCGCIVALRDRWDALRARLREWLAVARLAATGRLKWDASKPARR